MTTDNDELRSWATRYAERGWPVIPLHSPHHFEEGTSCSCGRSSCHSIGKHPRTRNGVKDASSDLEVVHAWWERWPEANVGLACGAEFSVLDLDSRDALNLVLDWAKGELPDTQPVAVSGRGLHLYFRSGPSSRAGVGGAAIDWLATGKLVVAPPSRHASGSTYRWSPPQSVDVPLPPIPTWLARLVDRRDSAPEAAVQPVQPVSAIDHSDHPPRGPVGALVAVKDVPIGLEDFAEDAARVRSPAQYARSAFHGEIRRVAIAPIGQRNNQLFQSAARLAEFVLARYLGSDEVIIALRAAAASAGLEQLEADRTIQSAFRRVLRVG